MSATSNTTTSAPTPSIAKIHMELSDTDTEYNNYTSKRIKRSNITSHVDNIETSQQLTSPTHKSGDSQLTPTKQNMTSLQTGITTNQDIPTPQHSAPDRGEKNPYIPNSVTHANTTIYTDLLEDSITGPNTDRTENMDLEL